MEELDLFELDSFEDIYNYCAIYLKDYYRDRIYELYSIVRVEEDQEFCLQSLKCLIYFITNLNLSIETKSITVSDDGLFYLYCKLNKDSYTLKFNSSGKVDYLINRNHYSSIFFELLDTLNKSVYSV